MVPFIYTVVPLPETGQQVKPCSDFICLCVKFTVRLEQFIDGLSILILSICYLSVGLDLKQRQRQDTKKCRCKHHLLTLGLIKTLYHKTVERNWRKHWSKNAGEKSYNNYNASYILMFFIKSHILYIKSTKYSTYIDIFYSVYTYSISIIYWLRITIYRMFIYLRQTE